MASSQPGSYVALELTERTRTASEGSGKGRFEDNDEIGGDLNELFWMKVSPCQVTNSYLEDNIANYL